MVFALRSLCSLFRGCSFGRYRCVVQECGTSTWSTRGWTLQELVASPDVLFYIGSWKRFYLSFSQLAAITRIPERVLQHGVTEDISVAQKMRWASTRRTTREEDMAYSLLGLFDVNMPLLYGEGAKAFIRLQEEIIRRSSDRTIFLWQDRHSTDMSLRGTFARHPLEFEDCGTLTCGGPFSRSVIPYSLTNIGLQITLRMCPLESDVIKIFEDQEQDIVGRLAKKHADLFIPILHVENVNHWNRTIVLRRLDEKGEIYASVGTNCVVEFNGFILTTVHKHLVEDHPVKQIHIVSTVRANGLPSTLPVSGFRFVTETRSSYDDLKYIDTEDNSNGWSVWDQGVLRAIAGLDPPRAVLSLQPDESLFSRRTYMILSVDKENKLATDRTYGLRASRSYALPTQYEIENHAGGYLWEGSSMTMFKDQLVL